MFCGNASECQRFSLTADHDICSTRRDLLIAPLLAALPLAMLGAPARAGQINPAETKITLPTLSNGAIGAAGRSMPGKSRRCTVAWTSLGPISC